MRPCGCTHRYKRRATTRNESRGHNGQTTRSCTFAEEAYSCCSTFGEPPTSPAITGMPCPPGRQWILADAMFANHLTERHTGNMELSCSSVGRVFPARAALRCYHLERTRVSARLKKWRLCISTTTASFSNILFYKAVSTSAHNARSDIRLSD